MICSVQGCVKRVRNPGGIQICRMHRLRMQRRGDYGFTYSGENHWAWLGHGVTYSGAHQRVNSVRGRADAQTCSDCGHPAAHWSYNRSGVAESIDDRGIRYSSDPTQYDPRCVPCHKRFDLEALATHG